MKKETNSILSNQIIVILLLLPYFKPELLNYMRGFNLIFTFLFLVSAGATVLLYIKMSRYVSFFLLAVWCYQLLLVTRTVSVVGLDFSGFRRLFSLIFLCALVELLLLNDIKMFLDSLYKILWLWIIINFVTELMRDVGFGPVYFFGFRVAFVYPMLMAIMLGYMLVITYGEQYRLGLYIIIALTLFAMIFEWVGTGLVTIVFYLVACFAYKRSKKLRDIFTAGRAAIILIVLNCLIVFVRIQNVFEFFIVDILGKSLTLTGRTYIWDAAIELIKRNPVWGYGIETHSVEVFFGEYKYMHNQILQFLVEGGAVGTLLFTVCMILCCQKLKKYRHEPIMIPVTIAIIANFILMIAEIPCNYVYIFITMFLAFWSDKIVEFYHREKKDGIDNGCHSGV